MNIQFWKMHGASNDFILVDDRNLTFPEKDGQWISSISARRTGIGAEGIILIQPSSKASFRMRFFNPDGSEVEMCGNGARCVARLACDIGAAPQSLSIDTVAGILTAEIKGNLVQLGMTDPRNWALNESLDVAGTRMICHSVNSGVPHAVTEVKDLAHCDVQKLGAALRNHTRFAPAGTNANFISVTGPDSILIRTYERGVEAETLACGTGIVASALIAVRLGRVSAPVRVHAASGDILTVGMTTTPDGAKNVTLLGPAEYVFTGSLQYPGSPAGRTK